MNPYDHTPPEQATQARDTTFPGNPPGREPLDEPQGPPAFSDSLDDDPRPTAVPTPPDAADWSQDTDPVAWVSDLAQRMHDRVKAHALPEELLAPDTLRRLAVLAYHHPKTWDLVRPILTKAVPWKLWRVEFREAQDQLRADWQQAEVELALMQLAWDLEHHQVSSWEQLADLITHICTTGGPDYLRHPLVLRALGLAWADYRDGIERLGRSLTNGRWLKTDWTDWLKSIARLNPSSASRRKAQERGLQIVSPSDSASTPGDGVDHPMEAMEVSWDPDLPPAFDGLVVPEGYRVTRQGLFQITWSLDGEPVERLVAQWPLVILRHLTNLDTDQEYADLGWLSPHSERVWKRRIVSHGVISHAQQIVTLADYGAPVNSNNAKAIIAFLDAFHRANADHYPRVFATSRLGWQSHQRGFAVGVDQYYDATGTLQVVEFLADSAGDQQKAQGFHAQGDAASWWAMLDDVVAFPAVMIAVLSSLATPLLHLIGAPNFVLDYGGITSSGKTTTLEIAASVWGQPDLKNGPAAMFSWASTNVGVEMLSQLISGLPVILDDTKTVQGNPRKVTEILYGIVSGIGKMRGAKAGGSRATGHWRTILLSSGEQPITSFTTDGGIKTRTLSVTQAPWGDEDQAELVQDIKRTIRAHYGHAGSAFIAWLLQHRDQWSTWAHAYQMRLADLGRHHTRGTARLMEYRALLEVTADLLDQAQLGGERAWTWGMVTQGEGWQELWNRFEEQANDPLGLHKALRQLGSWIQSHAEEFMGHRTDTDHPPLQWAGQWKLTSSRHGHPASPCIYTHVLEQLLMQWDYWPPAIIDGWYAQGWLQTEGIHRLPKVTILEGPDAGQRKRVFYVLSDRGMQVAFGEDEDLVAPTSAMLESPSDDLPPLPDEDLPF
ncbi:DUF927 domain-containing protein [Sulfobacillus thermosulfidooxidans]|uniref:DUF927 domain-containing protein n=1 Tax=Sulfobacillus thermosulfidooxidans TaxID=28034 RepID=UPI0006B40B13|nr:DUF927 domain-containing protein [Sulfobacillus thermosulfidooxidans]